MFVITFYSYKGGVGRTSALMNSAHRLTQKGKRVFILDFDLEAPGVDAFDPSQTGLPKPGLVEYISRFVDSGEVAPLEEFVYDIPSKSAQGAISVMPAGRKDENYQASLSRLDWKFLYKQKSGFFFVENLKAAIRERYAPDYVLVDSRTGLTDISGICTLQLPDLVVLLFSLNNQNVRGTAQIYKTIKFNKLNRSIKTLLVASPIPDVPESIGIRRERFEHARKSIGTAPDLILPFDPFMAFEETIAGAGQSQGLMKAYEELTDRLVASNPSDTLTLLKDARHLTETGNAELAELKYREILEIRPESWEAWTSFGIFQRTRGRANDAAECFAKAMKLAPSSVRPIAQMSSTALELGHLEEAKVYAKRMIGLSSDAEELAQLGSSFQRRGLPEVAYDAFKKAAEISPGEEAFFNWGEASMALGHYDEAFNAYRRAMQGRPTELPPVYNTAYAASKLGRAEAKDLFRKAVQLYENQQGKRPDANALAAVAIAYLETGRPDKALRHLRNAKKLAMSGDSSTIFSPSAYTHVPKSKFVDDIDAQIKQIETEYKEALAAPAAPTILTAMKSQGEFVLTFKREERVSRRTARSASAVSDLLASLGMDRASANRYAQSLERGHAVQTIVDVDPELIFDASS
jgi:tetratricopeptide (TPR) repeat protein